MHQPVLVDGVTLPSQAAAPVHDALRARLGAATAEQLHPYHLEAAVMEAVWTISSSRYQTLLQNKRLLEQGRLVPEGAEELAIRYYRQAAATAGMLHSSPSPSASPARASPTAAPGFWHPGGGSPRQRLSPHAPAGAYGSPRGSPSPGNPGIARMRSPAQAVAALSHGEHGTLTAA